MINLPSIDDQLKLFSETAYRVSHAEDEEKRFQIVHESFRVLGFGGPERWRVGQLVDNGKSIALKYGDGDYGALNLSEVKYDVGDSITSSVIDNENPKFFTSEAMAYLVMPLFKAGKAIGILSLDSTDLAAYPDDVIRAVDIYKFLMASSFDESADPVADDIVAMVTKLKRQQVLVLGKDTDDQMRLLTSACSVLTGIGYKPILVKDQPDFPEMSNEEKVRVFADTSKFVLLENSFPAGQIAELKMCSTNRIIAACLREAGKGSSWMVTDYFEDFNFIKEFEYEPNPESYACAIKSATSWAEQIVGERIAYYDSKYPWRKSRLDGSSDGSGA